MRVITVYDVIRHRAAKDGKCPVCERPVRRSKTFTMTDSPFNKNPDGTRRTVEEIEQALYQQSLAWVPDFRHAACRNE